MSNEYTKNQIREFLRNAVERAKNPNPREEIRKAREKKKKKLFKVYGL